MAGWLADTQAIALVVNRRPATIRSWANRYRERLPRLGTGDHGQALYDVEEAEKIAWEIAHGGVTRRRVQH